jgi:hypothetical protein
VLELAVAALLRNLKPAIVLNQFQHVANFHANCSILAVIIAPIGIQSSSHSLLHKITLCWRTISQ